MNFIDGSLLSKQEKTQQLILSILASIGAKPNVNREFLKNLIYLVDFNHHESHECSVTGSQYFKTICGAESKVFESALQDLLSTDKVVKITKTLKTGYVYDKLLPTELPNNQVFSILESETIQECLECFGDFSLDELREKVQFDTPLMMAEVGEKLDYEYVFYRTEEEEE